MGNSPLFSKTKRGEKSEIFPHINFYDSKEYITPTHVPLFAFGILKEYRKLVDFCCQLAFWGNFACTEVYFL